MQLVEAGLVERQPDPDNRRRLALNLSEHGREVLHSRPRSPGQLAEGLEQHIPKGYIYFAMAFSVLVEMLNLKMKKGTSKPVDLHNMPQQPVEGGSANTAD